MKRAQRWTTRLAAALALTAPVAQAVIDPAMVGSWQAGTPGQAISLQILPDGRCALAGHQVVCASAGAMMMFQSAEGSLAYQWSVSAGVLQLSRGDAASAVSFQRLGDKAAPPALAQAQPAPAPAPAVSPRPPVAAAANPSAAPQRDARSTVQKEAWGLSFVVPGGWRAVEKDGSQLVVSDTEAGLILLQFLPRSSRQELLAGYREGLHDPGFVARPVAEASEFDAPGGAALAGLMEGRAQDGSTIRVRSIGVLSRFGGAVVVLGLTTPQQFQNLQARVESIARSLAFQAPPKAAPIAGQYQYVYVAKTGSYSREASLTLCASGRFSKSGEMSGSGSAGSAYVGGGNAGNWSAVGDGSAGTLTLNFNDGGSASLPYRVSTNPRDRSAWGPAITFGNELYQRSGAGNC